MIINGIVAAVGQIYSFNDNSWEIMSVDTMSCEVHCIYGSWNGTLKQTGSLVVHYRSYEFEVDLTKWILTHEPKSKASNQDEEFDDDIPF